MQLNWIQKSDLSPGLKNRLSKLTLHALNQKSDMWCFLFAEMQNPPTIDLALLATEGDEILGWACVYGWNRFYEKGIHAYANVFVDPNHRNKGIGKALVSAIRENQSYSHVRFADTPFFRKLFPDASPFLMKGIPLLEVGGSV